MQIKIKKLFGERNYNIEFNSDLTILIGENGAGKSTIIKILNDIFESDLVSLSQIDFESITLTVPLTEQNRIIDIVDGQPHPRKKIEVNILKKDIEQLDYVKDARFKIIFRNFLYEYNFEKDIEEANLNFDRFLKEFDIKFQKEKSGIKIRPSLEIDKDDDMQIYFNKEKYEETEKMINYAYFDYTLDAYNINYCEVMQNIKIPYGSLYYLKVLYLTFIRKVILFNIRLKEGEKIERPFITKMGEDNIKTPLKSETPFAPTIITRARILLHKNIDFSLFSDYYDCTIFIRNKDSYHIDKFDFDKKGIDRKRILLLYEYVHNEMVMLNEVIYCESEDYVRYQDNNKYKSPLISDEKLLELLKHLSSNQPNKKIITKDDNMRIWFKEFFTNQQLEKYSNILNLIKLSYKKDSKTKEQFTALNYKEYIEIAKESNIVFLENLEKENYCKEDWILELADHMDSVFVDPCITITNTSFFKTNFFGVDEPFEKMDKLNIKDYQDSKEAKTFYDLTGRYFTNKDFLLLYDQEGSVITKIYDKKSGQELKEENLSSGEYKVLRLIKKLSFMQNYSGILILDEPELSLSIYWQKMLIDDILKYFNKAISILVTQSTNLVKENHYRYLKEVNYDEEL